MTVIVAPGSPALLESNTWPVIPDEADSWALTPMAVVRNATRAKPNTLRSIVEILLQGAVVGPARCRVKIFQHNTRGLVLRNRDGGPATREQGKRRDPKEAR